MIQGGRSRGNNILAGTCSGRWSRPGLGVEPETSEADTQRLVAVRLFRIRAASVLTPAVGHRRIRRTRRAKDVPQTYAVFGEQPLDFRYNHSPA